jgi:hypothetical protein
MHIRGASCRLLVAGSSIQSLAGARHICLDGVSACVVQQSGCQSSPRPVMLLDIRAAAPWLYVVECNAACMQPSEHNHPGGYRVLVLTEGDLNRPVDMKGMIQVNRV